MKKIVIISQQGRINDDLIALLTALFPECGISIAAADTQDLSHVRRAHFPRQILKTKQGHNHAKNFSAG